MCSLYQTLSQGASIQASKNWKFILPQRFVPTFRNLTCQRSLFPTISSYDCVPLPRPVDSEEQLQQVESMDFAQLKGAFLEEYYLLEVGQLLRTLFPAHWPEFGGIRGRFSISLQSPTLSEQKRLWWISLFTVGCDDIIHCLAPSQVNGSMLADMIGKYVKSIASRSGLLSSIASIPR